MIRLGSRVAFEYGKHRSVLTTSALLGVLAMTAACAVTPTPLDEQATVDACRYAVNDPSVIDDPDARVVVMRDRSREVKGFAGAGPAGGGAIDGAGTVIGTTGFAVGTNRGGATAFAYTEPNVSMVSCDDVLTSE